MPPFGSSAQPRSHACQMKWPTLWGRLIWPHEAALLSDRWSQSRRRYPLAHLAGRFELTCLLKHRITRTARGQIHCLFTSLVREFLPFLFERGLLWLAGHALLLCSLERLHGSWLAAKVNALIQNSSVQFRTRYANLATAKIKSGHEGSIQASIAPEKEHIANLEQMGYIQFHRIDPDSGPPRGRQASQPVCPAGESRS